MIQSDLIPRYPSLPPVPLYCTQIVAFILSIAMSYERRRSIRDDQSSSSSSSSSSSGTASASSSSLDAAFFDFLDAGASSSSSSTSSSSSSSSAGSAAFRFFGGGAAEECQSLCSARREEDGSNERLVLHISRCTTNENSAYLEQALLHRPRHPHLPLPRPPRRRLRRLQQPLRHQSLHI